MDVETAEAQLEYARTAEEYRAAKLAYQVDAAELADPADSEKKPAFVKARDALVAARDDWRNNYRTAPDGPGDGTANPDPLSVSVVVNEEDE